jgi:HAMP domain-containing protein
MISSRVNKTAIAVAALSVAMAAVLAYAMERPVGPPMRAIGSYATDLSNRTPHQRFNARRAAAAIDGAVIAPGAQFSFNATVKGWSADRGYRKAPVSYDGVLIDDYGGGVCETSTTIYNAALIAGLAILERHPHTFAPSYAPVGRDAAVAYPGIDLRIRNPYPYPITIRVSPRGRMLVCGFEAPTDASPRFRIVAETTAVIPAPPLSASALPSRPTSRWRLEGCDGYHVAVYRERIDPTARFGRELISDDTYQPLSAVRVE